MTSIHEPSTFAMQSVEPKLRSPAPHVSTHFESIMQETASSELAHRPAPGPGTGDLRGAPEVAQQDETRVEGISVFRDAAGLIALFTSVEHTQQNAAMPLTPTVDFAAHGRGQGDAALASSFNTAGDTAVAETANYEISVLASNTSGWHPNVRAATGSLSQISSETYHLPARKPDKLDASLQQMTGLAAAGSDASVEVTASPPPVHTQEGGSAITLEASSVPSPSATTANGLDAIQSREFSLNSAGSPALLVADAIVRTAPTLGGTTSTAMTAGLAPSDAAYTAMVRNSDETVKRLRVKLHPAQLGEVEVCIVMKGSNLNIQLRAETPEAKQALTSSHFEMLEALSAHGLRLEKLLVELSVPVTPLDAANLPSPAVQSQPHYGSPEHQQSESRGNDGSEHSLRSRRSEQASHSVETSSKQGVFV